MPTVYRKTTKGVTEMETRTHRLPPRLRSALIMVDGRRSDLDLRAVLQQHTDETLGALLAQGFIEVASASGPAAAGTAAASAAPAAPAPAAAALSSADFERLRRDAVRTLSDLIGPASETLALRMERARTLDELRPLLALAAQSVGHMRGRQAAADYAARFGVS